MSNAEKEEQVLHENAANFYDWIREAKKRLSEEESRAKLEKAQSERKSDRAA